jgi:hypothetical protein
LRQNIKHFNKYSAIDCAFMKRFGGGQGTLYLEAVVDASRQIHGALVMHLIATECDFGMDLHHKHANIAYDGEFNKQGRVCGSDGGISLCKGIKTHRPQVHPLRDTRHLAADIKSKRVASIFNKVYNLPPSRRDDADEIFAHLQSHDPVVYKTLVSVPLTEWCRPYLPPGACHHGNGTTNVVEILALMLLTTRRQSNLVATFFCVKNFFRSRWLNLYQTATQLSRHAPVRVEKLEAKALALAKKSQCSIAPETYKYVTRDQVLQCITGATDQQHPIVVSCQREGKLALSSDDSFRSTMRNAWTFVNGDRGTIRQSHSVGLHCIRQADWWNLCTCRRNGTEITYCSHVTYVLEVFDLMGFMRKPFNSKEAQLSQIGQAPPQVATFETIMEHVNTRHTTSSLKTYILPSLSNSLRGGRPAGNATEERKPSYVDFQRGAQAVMEASAAEAVGHVIPGVSKHPSQPRSSTTTDTATAVPPPPEAATAVPPLPPPEAATTVPPLPPPEDDLRMMW